MVSLLDISLKEWQDRNLEYLRYEYDLKPTDKVIDIGSYRQEWADGIRSKYGCKVDCFEALDNRAAWTHNGTIELGGQFYYSSSFDQNNRNRFNCVDIAPYLQDIALLKVNIEGMEYELLNYIIDKGLIENINELQVQFHLIEGTDTEEIYQQLAERLRKTHRLTWQYPFCWENWKRNA